MRRTLGSTRFRRRVTVPARHAVGRPPRFWHRRVRHRPAARPAPIASPASSSRTSATGARATSAPGSPTPSPAIVWTDAFDDLLDERRRHHRRGGWRRRAGRRLRPRGAARREVGRHREQAGRSRITARRCSTLAERQGRQLRFEAAVGGAMPIVRALGDGLGGDRVDAHRRDSERHEQRRAVPDGRDRRARSTRRSPTRARAATPRPIRRPTSTASTRRRSSRFCARSAFGLRVEPVADRDADDRADSAGGLPRRARRGRDHPADRPRRLRPRAVDADGLGGADVRAAARRCSRGRPVRRTPRVITGAHAGDIDDYRRRRRRRRHGGRRDRRPRRDRARSRGDRSRARCSTEPTDRSEDCRTIKLAEAV